MVFTLRDDKGEPLTEGKALALPKERRVEIDRPRRSCAPRSPASWRRRAPMERVMNEALAALRRQIIKPLLEHELQEIRNELRKQIKDSVKLGNYLDQVMHDVLENLELFQVGDRTTRRARNCACRRWPRCWRATR